MDNNEIIDGIAAAVEFNQALSKEALSESGAQEIDSSVLLTDRLVKTLEDSGASNEVIFAAVMQLSSRAMNQLAKQIKDIS